MLQQLRTAILLLATLTMLTGGVYPAVVTVIAQLAFPHQANGSLLHAKDQAIGSELIGQPFTSPRYFWGRLSATAPVPYNAAASSGSNYGPLHPGLAEAAQARIADLQQWETPQTGVPADLATASGSGLDPHISLAAAEFQIPRIATERQMTTDRVRELIHAHTAGRQWGVLGEPRVNVLQLNLALDAQNTK